MIMRCRTLTGKEKIHSLIFSNMNKSLPVFTTRFVLDSKSEIVYVTHDEDGDWQFFGKEEISEQDARITSLGEILEIDSSLEELMSMPQSAEAWREEKGGKWTITQENESAD